MEADGMRTEVEGMRVVDLDELAETGEVTKVGGEIRRQTSYVLAVE